MKIKVHPDIVNNVRLAIKQTKESLDENREQRKKLITDIRQVKNGIRARESVCSKMAVAGLDTQYQKVDIETQRRHLNNLRQNLIGAFVYRSVELAKFRALHKQLDNFNEPFDPVRKAEKHGKQID